MTATAKASMPQHDYRVSADKIEQLRSLGFSNEELYRIVAPRRTLARRIDHDEPLSQPESDRAVRLERIAEHADSVFADREKALRWLRKISRVLGDRPIDMLHSEVGARLVEEELNRIDYGIYV